MAALDYLRRAGLAIELEGERLRVTPADRLTDAHRQYLRDHKAELLAELIAANDSRQTAPEPPHAMTAAPAGSTPAPAAERPAEAVTEPKRNAWTITRGGKPVCTICGAPMTRDEAWPKPAGAGRMPIFWRTDPMTPNQATALAGIAMKPTISKRDSLIVARRLARYFCESAEAIHDERRLLRREAAVLRQFEPFTKRQADALERRAKDYGADTLATIRNVLMELGKSLLHDRDGYLAALGFDGVCDVLNVNTVEREQARREGVGDLSELVFIRNLEDSASHRGEDFKQGPLFEACFAAMGHFIRTAPEGTLPDPFGPGGPLYGAPVRMVQPDGAVTIKRPDLTVHDASGSRVVKR